MMMLEAIGDSVDVLVVGAGPAGLFAALGVAITSNSSVLVIDAGLALNERLAAASALQTSATRTIYASGVGGAGLFADGKFTYSLAAGGHLGALVSSTKAEALLDVLSSVLGMPRPSDVEESERPLGTTGLFERRYPVNAVGTERCRELTALLLEKLARRNVRVVSGTVMESLELRSSGDINAYLAVGGRRTSIRARNIVLALGKMGAVQQRSICDQLNVQCISVPADIGVRVETDAEVLSGLFERSPDPKLIMHFPDGSRMKTHCATRRGQVLCVKYGGLSLAGGQNLSHAQTRRSGFALLWNGAGPWLALDLPSLDLAGLARQTEGRLLSQRLVDFRRELASSPANLSAAPLSCGEVAAGDIRRYFPGEYCTRLQTFLDCLGRIAPCLWREDSVIYAPAVEWWMSRVATLNSGMETTRKGVFVAGDGSGWTQGIIQAAASGLLAAEGITGLAVSSIQASAMSIIP